MDVAEVQKAVTDELKRVQKDDFLEAFQKLCNCAKTHIYANEAYFELKKKDVRLPHMSSIFKKAVLKLLDCTVYTSWDAYISFF